MCLCSTPDTGSPGELWICPVCKETWIAMVNDDNWNITWENTGS